MPTSSKLSSLFVCLLGATDRSARGARTLFGPLGSFCFQATIAASLAFGQSGNILSGVVKDPTGAVVRHAAIALTEIKTAARRSTPSGYAGAYSFPNLPSGSYSIEVAAVGFSVFGTSVTVGVTPLALDIPLALAQQSDQVSVVATVDPFNVVPSGPTPSLFGLDKSIEDTPRRARTG